MGAEGGRNRRQFSGDDDEGEDEDHELDLVAGDDGQQRREGNAFLAGVTEEGDEEAGGVDADEGPGGRAIKEQLASLLPCWFV